MKKLIFLLPALLACSQLSAQNLVEKLAGNWQFTAANNGVEVAPGIYSAGTDIISFTATPSADGKGLDCHADCLYNRTGTEYPANWRILVEENAEGKHRLGWVLDPQQPVSPKEFLEPRENYLEKGFFYWAENSEGHRYIYLLAENADASAIVGMTFWSPWSDGSTTEYPLSNEENNAQKMYAVVAQSIPYANSVGWIEIWASPKVQKLNNQSGVAQLSVQHDAKGIMQPNTLCNLNGQRIKRGTAGDSKLPRGIYILNGKKILIGQ